MYVPYNSGPSSLAIMTAETAIIAVEMKFPPKRMNDPLVDRLAISMSDRRAHV